ncbi:hypothetical protein [Taylorella equigenitalis]|uniref:hypothetical protein n=1 Tax=Taylorella equigenitalis TaxID=29575 RepID=UPI000422D29A|nr:hypothetical protein [Taylorella equigenitalis]WDU46457.1 hypothetical protein KNO33_00310 [Taylorella equigenitalis]
MFMGLSGWLAVYLALDLAWGAFIAIFLVREVSNYLNVLQVYSGTQIYIFLAITVILLAFQIWILYKRIPALMAKNRSPETPNLVVKTMWYEIVPLLVYALINIYFAVSFGLNSSKTIISYVVLLAIVSVIKFAWTKYYQQSPNVRNTFGSNANADVANLLKPQK